MIQHNLAILMDQVTAHLKGRISMSEEYYDLRAEVFGEMTVAGGDRDKVGKHLDAYEAAVLAPLIAIIDDYVIESNDVGGLDCNDLVSRMNAAGYFLPEGDE